MISPFRDLYETRLEYAQATPGSREWWRAIRKMRSARQRIEGIVDAIVSGLSAAVENLRDSFRGLTDVMSTFDHPLAETED